MALCIFTSCQKEQTTSDPDQNLTIAQKSGPGECDVTTELLAGQHIPVGVVHVTHDEESLYITYLVNVPGWSLEETHLHVAANVSMVPQTKSGNPKPGKFDYQSEHDGITVFTYEVPIMWMANASIVIAAHAMVSYEPGDGTMPEYAESMNETAWADGNLFPGSSWATYFDYILCFEYGGGIGPETEIAYAYAPEGNYIYSKCFLDLNIADFWGFQIGAFNDNQTFELWALPYDCDLSTGFHIGEVVIEVRNAKKMDVTITTFPGYSFHEAHLWLGNSSWPGPGMVGPQEFPYHAWDLSGSMVYTFQNVPRTEDMYMILQALVYGVVHYG